MDASELEKDDAPLLPGRRRDTLYAVGLSMRRRGCDSETVYETLIRLNRRRCRPPLEYMELREVAMAIMREPLEAGDLPLLEDDRDRTIAEFCADRSPVQFRRLDDRWLILESGRYRPADEETVMCRVRQAAEEVRVRTADGGRMVHEPLWLTRRRLKGVLDSLAVLKEVWMPDDLAPPAWLIPKGDLPDPEDVIALDNGLLDISGDAPRLMEPTEDFFTLTYLPIRYDPQAACPKWLAFLDRLFPAADPAGASGEHTSGPQSIAVLQEFMGLLFTPVTRYRRALALVGPLHGGRDTLIRINRRLFGDENLLSLSPLTLAGHCGLHILRGRSVALISDVSFRPSYRLLQTGAGRPHQPPGTLRRLRRLVPPNGLYPVRLDATQDRQSV